MRREGEQRGRENEDEERGEGDGGGGGGGGVCDSLTEVNMNSQNYRIWRHIGTVVKQQQYSSPRVIAINPFNIHY